MIYQSLLTLLCLTLGGAAGDRATLDDFQDGLSRDKQATASPWKASRDPSLLSVSYHDGKPALRLAAPFQNHPDWDRVCVDRVVKMDLSKDHRFILEVDVEDLEPFGAATLYFKSKGGWYGCYGGFSRLGRQKLVFNKEDFRPEGKPAGWDQIDQIRVAFWQGQQKNGQVMLHRLSVPKPPVLIVAGGAAASKRGDSKEATSYAKQTAKTFEKLVAKTPIETKTVEEATLSTLDLKDFQVVVLPYNPQLLPEVRDKLVKYVEDGGKLFVCYQLDPKLGQAIGFQSDKWIKAPRKGGFAEIHFPSKPKAQSLKIPGVPNVVKQNSWNLTRAKPTGHHAEVAATWFDDAGKTTDEAALLVSDRGAYLSHIVLDDDPENKAAMLEAILGKLSPTIWKNLAEKQLEALVEVGHDSPKETDAWIKKQAVPQALAELQKSCQLESKARQMLQRDDVDAVSYYQAAKLAEQAQHAKQKAYVLSQRPPKPGQRRGFWNHSGMGIYADDWDRTMRELSEAGFNAIFPNMCWGGCAHYASEVLPQSKTYEKHGDQIAQAVAAGKKYGVEVHVWKVNHYLSHRTPREFVEKLRREERLVKSVRGEELEWLCPSHPKNFELERDAMLEMAQKYDVDGIHFDYIRYKSGDYCFCDGCRKRFEAASGKKVENWPQDCYSGSRKEEYHDWRCGNITRLVKAVHDEVQKTKPEVKVSAAVFSNYPSCRRSVAQDWLLWAKKGYVDFLCPMDYQLNELSYENMVARQMQQVDGAVPLCPGIGASYPTRMTAEQVAAQIFLTERLGTAGFTIFNLSPREAESVLPAFKEAQEVRRE